MLDSTVDSFEGEFRIFASEVPAKELTSRQSLGDAIVGMMRGQESIALAELVLKFSDIGSIECNYEGRGYVVQLEGPKEIPMIRVRDIGSGREWIVMLKGDKLNGFYSRVASHLRLAVNEDKVGVANSRIRGVIGNLLRFSGLGRHFKGSLHDNMGPSEMTKFLGERLFNPDRESPHLEYVEVGGRSI